MSSTAPSTSLNPGQGRRALATCLRTARGGLEQPGATLRSIRLRHNPAAGAQVSQETKAYETLTGVTAYWNHNSAYHDWISAVAMEHHGTVLDVGCGEAGFFEYGAIERSYDLVT